jgi:hypothetical protein
MQTVRLDSHDADRRTVSRHPAATGVAPERAVAVSLLRFELGDGQTAGDDVLGDVVEQPVDTEGLGA